MIYVKLKGGPECIKANKIHMIKHQGAWEKLSKEVKQGAFTHP